MKVTVNSSLLVKLSPPEEASFAGKIVFDDNGKSPKIGLSIDKSAYEKFFRVASPEGQEVDFDQTWLEDLIIDSNSIESHDSMMRTLDMSNQAAGAYIVINNTQAVIGAVSQIFGELRNGIENYLDSLWEKEALKGVEQIIDYTVTPPMIYEREKSPVELGSSK